MGPVERLIDGPHNVLTGITLDALVGERFRIGGAVCFGQRLCEYRNPPRCTCAEARVDAAA